MKFQAPKGTRDFYPADMAIRNWIEARWREVSLRNGFVEYDGPVFEDLDLYRVKSGDEIVSQLFHFSDRGDRKFALRPEMTPTLARMVAARAQSLAKPIKWFSVPRLCRAERPQRGRLREFFQWNIDILGEDDPIADAECVFVAVDFFRCVGLSPQHVQIKINSRAVVAALLEALGIPAERHQSIYAVLDKRDKLPTDKFAATVADLGVSAEQHSALLRVADASGRAGLDDVERMLAGHASGLEHCRWLQRVFELLKSMGAADYCQYDMGVVRGLAYYTGMVFEAFGQGGLKRALCGGGRYDRLLSDLGGPPLGGVGFATSDVVIQDLLEEVDKLPSAEAETNVFVIDADAEAFDKVLAIAAELRGMGISAAFSYKRQAVAKQFKQASACRARRVVVVPLDFADAGQIEVKDMETGQSRTLEYAAWRRTPLSDWSQPQ